MTEPSPVRAVLGYCRVPHAIIHHATTHAWTARQWRVYLALVQRCDRVTWLATSSQIARQVGATPGNVRAAIAELQRQDIIRRDFRQGNRGSSFRFAWLDYEPGEQSQGASNSKHQGASNSKREGASNSKRSFLTPDPGRKASPSCLPADEHPEQAGRQAGDASPISDKLWIACADAFPAGVYDRERWSRVLRKLTQQATDAELRPPTIRELLGYLGHAAHDPSLMRAGVRDPLAVACTPARWLNWWTPRARPRAAAAE